MATRSKTARVSRRTQAQRRATTRQRLVEATLACVAEGGFRSATMDGIARRAGVTVGAVQHHFSDKFGLLRAVAAQGLDELGGRLATVAPLDGSIQERVDALVDELWSGYSAAKYQGLIEIQRAMRYEPGFRKEADSHMSAVRQIIDRMWMAMFWDSRLTREQHIAAERLLFGALNGLALEMYISTTIPDAEIELAILKGTIVRFLMSGEP